MWTYIRAAEALDEAETAFETGVYAMNQLGMFHNHVASHKGGGFHSHPSEQQESPAEGR